MTLTIKKIEKTIIAVMLSVVVLFGAFAAPVSAQSTYHMKYTTVKAKPIYECKTYKTYKYCIYKKYDRGCAVPYAKVCWNVDRKTGKITKIWCNSCGVDTTKAHNQLWSYEKTRDKTFISKKGKKKGYVQRAWLKKTTQCPDASNYGISCTEVYVINAIIKPNGTITYNRNMIVHKNAIESFPWGTTKWN